MSVPILNGDEVFIVNCRNPIRTSRRLNRNLSRHVGKQNPTDSELLLLYTPLRYEYLRQANFLAAIPPNLRDELDDVILARASLLSRTVKTK